MVKNNNVVLNEEPWGVEPAVSDETNQNKQKQEAPASEGALYEQICDHADGHITLPEEAFEILVSDYLQARRNRKIRTGEEAPNEIFCVVSFADIFGSPEGEVA